MESLAAWFAATLGKYLSAKAVVFIVSLMPILECRGGLLVASLLKVDILEAIPICVVGNLLPIPFILLFITRIFAWLKNFKVTRGIVEKLEARAMNKSDALSNGEFIGLMLFVGIPLPGTGGWTGSLIAALLKMDFKKAILACFVGVLLATVIVSFLSYGLLARVVA
jgi:uncharacterized membrane protein